MRVLGACSLGGAGHLNPMAPVLDAARRRGHDVLVVAPPALREMVEAAGFAFHAGGEPDERDIAPIREQLPVVPPEEASILGNRELFGRLAAAAMLPATGDVCRTWRPDLVVRDPCEYASGVVAPALGIPTVQIAISVAEAEAGSIAAAAPALEEHRAGLVDELLRSPYLTRMPASLDPSPFPTTVRFHDPRPATAEPLPDWWGGRGGPLVYLTFGTVVGHLSTAASIYRSALDDVASLGTRVLLTVGRKLDPRSLGDVPANTHVERWVDHDRVVREADVVVCHGGSGTVYGSLDAGVPVVVAPVFGDQRENARRVARAGAGLAVDADAGRSGGDLAAAVRAVLEDPSYRRRAREIATEVASTDTVDDVVAWLETLPIAGSGTPPVV
jgi:UDP:flavonoid glycosyltransferase YjiC (YdhE family)